MLPEGWDTYELGDLAEFKSGGTPSTQNAGYWGGAFPWVSAKDLKSHYITKAELGLTKSGELQANIAPVESILVLVRGMTLLKDVPIGLVMRRVAFNQDIKALIANANVDPLFLSYFLVLQKRTMMALVNTANHGTGRLDTDLLRGLSVLLPPLPEQRKIAEILSTWDAAIQCQERLIANAKRQKQALMQTLLATGNHPPKKRLPGFSGDWREIKLRELGRCYNGVTYSPADVVDGNGLLILRSSNVQKGRLDFGDTVYVKPDVKTSCLTQDGDILICVRNGSRNLIGKTARITSDATGHAHGAFMSLFRSTEPDFAYHLFKSHTYDQQVKRNLGATINSINTSDLHNFRFMVPPKPERARIAEILSANDREIEHHEKLLLGTCAQKSALMQQLLSGKRRAKVGAVANA